jgi:hypothetical protein
MSLQNTQQLSTGFTIRLDEHAKQQIIAIAQAKGIKPTTLMRIWLQERLKQEIEIPNTRG